MGWDEMTRSMRAVSSSKCGTSVAQLWTMDPAPSSTRGFHANPCMLRGCRIPPFDTRISDPHPTNTTTTTSSSSSYTPVHVRYRAFDMPLNMSLSHIEQYHHHPLDAVP